LIWHVLSGRAGQPRRYGRLVSAFLAVFVATSGVAAATVSLSGGSRPPVRLPGGGGLCPVSYPYVADTSQKLAYSPNYPGPPLREAGSIRCFASAHDARAAGYTLASAPTGDTMLGGLYLAPTPAAVRGMCQVAGRLTRTVVYCPGRLPVPWLRGGPACPLAGCSMLSISGSFTAPASYVGSSAGIGDLTIWEGPARQLRVYLPYFAGCGFGADPRPIGHISFRGHPAAWYSCSISADSTGSLLAWRIGGESYGITADGPARLRHRLVEYIAAHLVRSPS
jgi:hypothetical protein